MKPPLIIFIHGGEAFDSWWVGLQSTVINYAKKLTPFKETHSKWPDRLQTELKDFSVVKLKMPAKYNAKYKTWERYFLSQTKNISTEVILLGWSLGTNFLAKYLAENKPSFTVKAVHLVAGCYGLEGGFDLPKHFPGFLVDHHVHLYHSTDDSVVDFKDFERYQQALPYAKVSVFSHRNHFLQPEFPELIANLKAENQ